jgi:selenocysteine lyase/cysteine desulfurase
LSHALDVDALRAQFASLPRLAYFNSGSYGLLADRVRDAFSAYLSSRDEKGADWGTWVAALEGARDRMARLLRVDPDDVAITASASAGINAIASGLDYAARPKIVVSNFEFPTSGQIWHAQEKAGARIVHVPESEDGLIPLERFAAEIDESTAIVAISQVCYRNGGRIPDEDIKALAAMAHAKGAMVIVDSYQIVGAAQLHPRDLGVDFCVGGMLKYLLGTAGIGFLYASPEAIARVTPRTTGWFAQTDIHAMDIFHNSPSPTARRFEGGTPPVPNCLAASAGLDVILEAGLPAIEARIAMLTGHAIERLHEHGIGLGSPLDAARRGPLLTIPASDDQGLVDALARSEVITSCRDGRVRAGFHGYNTVDDVERLIAAVVDNRALLV